MLKSYFEQRRQKRAEREAAYALLVKIVEAARQPVWFLDLEVEDAFDGRFDLVCLHVALVMHRLKDIGSEAHHFQAMLVEAYVADLEFGFREMGIADSGLNHKVKRMLSYFYGRLDGFEKARDDAALASALRRNLWRETEDMPISDASVARTVAYVQSLRSVLDAADFDAFFAGNIAFPAP